ncbi:MAG TPA: tetratricopeptide repeat protein [Acidobacteriota bacterium]
MRRGAPSAAIALALVAVLAGCATTAERLTPEAGPPPTRHLVPGPAEVPPPPADVAAEVRDAWVVLRSGDPGAAERPLATASPAVRDSAGAQTVLGFVALSRGQTIEARDHFQRALAASPDNAPALYGLGFAAEAQRDRTAALDAYGRATRADPGLSAAAVRLQILELEQAQALIADGELAEAEGDEAAALAAYEAANALGPELVVPYLRIAAIERRNRRLEEAVRWLRDARDRVGDLRVILRPLAETLQESGAYAEAYDVFESLQEVAPDDAEVRALVAAARELYLTAELPEEYRDLENKAEILREDLAALLAIRLPNLGERVPAPRVGVIITDVDGSWAEPYIRLVVAWGVMEVFQNHAFVADLVVKRQMFAEVAYRVLELLGATGDAARVRLADVPSEHYFHDQIQTVVGQGILELGPGNVFGILDPVSGEEAVEAVQRLVRLARSRDD